jgi:rare lipoprotein A
VASWYGPGFHGRPTSSREIYDQEAMTAAHRTLPFQTRVLVTNLDNGLRTEVRINDRGPFVKDRVIDLSLAAARRLDMVGPGTARVSLRILDRPAGRGSPGFVVQSGAFQARSRADAWAGRLRNDFAGAEVVSGETDSGAVYRVRIKARSRDEAERIAGALSARGWPALVLEIAP